MITISESEEPVTESQLVELERYIGSPLPASYRDFLSRHNGGRVSPDCFDFVRGGNVTHGGVDWFLAITTGGHNNLRDDIDTYSDRVPRGYIPIAYDSGGNLVVLSLRDDGVYFWDHDEEVEEGEIAGMQNMYWIAGSFDRFLDAIHEYVPRR